MPTLRRHRWALIAIALVVATCILFAALANPNGHFFAVSPLPVFLYVVALIIAYRRINYQLPSYIREPLASDRTFRGPPTF
jgi:hypothetical protein